MYIEEIRIGYCCHCDKPIINLKEKDPKKRKLPAYREKTLKLSDNSLMRIAICSDCEKIWSGEAAEKVMLRHHKTWKREIKESKLIPEEKKEKLLARYLSLESVKPDVNARQEIKKAKEMAKIEIGKDKTEKQKLEEENIINVEKAGKAEKKKLADEQKRHKDIIENKEKFEAEAKQEELKAKNKLKAEIEKMEIDREKEELKFNAEQNVGI